ncbi:Tir chaperone protein (CesT) [Pseudovibrio sp. Ad5]|uniref:type III secretion system chaperone n=2 Tax=unclassified Pseudovibrio TaxID=2627060 RepID=UPI0007AE5F27|nr:type III secretion system chaperone [Pseudovibrio sp. Ad5]KZK91162.1 Tir chaperone protein (CesT) [Pseudovibrio sp. Ad5]
MEMVENTLRQFGETIGLPDLKLDTENICSLTVDGEIEVFFQVLDFNANVVRLNSRLASLNNVPKSLYLHLLEANYNGMGTGHAALSINQRSSEVLLTQAIQVDNLSVEEFAETVKLFVKYTSFWVHELVELAKFPSDEPVPVQDMPVDSLNSQMQYLMP